MTADAEAVTDPDDSRGANADGWDSRESLSKLSQVEVWMADGMRCKSDRCAVTVMHLGYTSVSECQAHAEVARRKFRVRHAGAGDRALTARPPIID